MKYSEKNKPIVCMQTNNECYKNTKEMKILGILWHSTGANNPNLKRYVQPFETDKNYSEMIKLIGKNPNGNDWNHSNRQAGLNAWIGKLADGTISAIQTMPWNYRPWGCGKGDKGTCNDGWIQFEICEDALTNKTYFEAIYKEACELTAYLCKLHNIDPKGTVEFNGIKVPTILCHKDSYDLKLGSNHGDVLHWFSKFGKTMYNVRNDVANLLKLVEPEKVSQFKIGDEVKVKEGSTWSDGNKISSWVFDSKMYVRQFKDNQKIVISTQKTGATTGTIDESCLEPYKKTVVATPPSAPSEKPVSSKFKVGDAVRVKPEATWSNGKTISSWVLKSKMYVRKIETNGDIVISTQKTGATTGTIVAKYLIDYEDTTSPTGFIPYAVKVTASRLNVRAGAGGTHKVNTIVKLNDILTIVDEENGWGKLKNGKGWVSLKYTKKV